MQGSTEYLHDDEKAALRAQLRAARAILTPADRMDQANALRCVVMQFLVGGHGPGISALSPREDAPAETRGTIAAFIGTGPEPDTTPLLSALHTAAFDVVVPVCEADRRLSWVAWWPGVPLARSTRAPVDEPTGSRRSFAEVRDVRLVLVPALAVDRAGNRIGQGGGYYDRFLAQFPPGRQGNAPTMGVVFRSEVLERGRIPVDPLDQKLSGAFTADGPLRSEGS